MEITAFLHDEGSEPVVLTEEELDEDSGLGEDDGCSIREALDDMLGSVSLQTISVVSENVATIATFALHGALRASTVEEAHAWVLAGIRELAFYDRDGIEAKDFDGNGDHRAVDPGRPSCLTDYVTWPEANGDV